MMPDNYAGLPVDIVIANILLNPLLELAPKFAQMVNPRARVVLSGVMKDQVATLSHVYAAWFELEVARLCGDWACVVGGLARTSHQAERGTAAR